ncbi:hypothetical protein [Halomonas organivorans]|uniref:hypothetical protein n=1 Tax=Halomonas organivorans TaxID=257772 RepID=UPI0036250AC3
MATNIPTIDVPNFVGSNFDIGDTVEVITKQNDVNQKLLDFGDDLNVTVGAINTVGDEIEQTAQDAADSATLADNLADLVAETTATYTSVSAGLADTVDTDYFRVITAPTASEVAVYRNDGGSATLITTYYTQAGVDQRNAQATRLARSLQRRGDSGQALHSDFAYGAYGLGSRVSGGVDTALSGEELWDGFQRATPAWEWQPSGPNGELRITEVPADAIGRGWDPETGEPLGVAARPSSGNYALHSNDMSVSPWATGVGVSLTEVSGGRIVKDEPEWLVEGASSVGFSQENLRHALSGLTPDILYAYSIYVIPGPGCDSISLRSNSDSQGIGSNSYTTPVTPGQLVRVDAPFASSNDSGLVTISSAFASSPVQDLPLQDSKLIPARFRPATFPLPAAR